nr:Crp/Fnr family transcriptional regulator [Propylenella binzhouense]
MPGDLPDLECIHRDAADFSLGTLTPSRVGLIPHRALVDLISANRRIGAVLWRYTLIETAILREWTIGLGRRLAFERCAHLLCELTARMRQAGLATDGSYQLPVTQTDLGDILGLSTIHVNRVLRDLRMAGLAELRGGTVTVLDWQGLVDTSEFDGTYLRLHQPTGSRVQVPIS